MGKKNIKLIKISFILEAVFTSILGINITKYNDFFNPDSPLASGICFLLVILIFTFGIYFLSERCFNFGHILDFSDNRRVGIIWATTLIFILNMIMLIAYYPGTGSWDTSYQLEDFFDGTITKGYVEGGGMMLTANLNDHHPVLTTVIFAAFVIFGRWIGNEKFGVFLYSVIQVVLYLVVYTEVLRFNRKKGRVAEWITIVFYMTNLFLSYYAIMMLKDSLFTVLFLLYYLSYIKLYDCESDLPKKYEILFLCLSVIIPLTKKTGIYLIILSNLVMLIHMAQKKRT